MVDHSWVLEHIPSFTSGGLDPVERGSFEQHIVDCSDCARALEEAQHLEGTLDQLFRGDRPSPGLEDRIIQRLRNQPRRIPMLKSPYVRSLLGAAAVLLFGLL